MRSKNIISSGNDIPIEKYSVVFDWGKNYILMQWFFAVASLQTCVSRT